MSGCLRLLLSGFKFILFLSIIKKKKKSYYKSINYKTKNENNKKKIAERNYLTEKLYIKIHNKIYAGYVEL